MRYKKDQDLQEQQEHLVQQQSIANVGHDVSSQFNELRVAKKFPIVELTSVYGVPNLRDVVTTTGGGTVTNDVQNILLVLQQVEQIQLF
ncbi:hypothetical protein [Clostridium lacusfryxellense]|uniref:hypothetical protein n=1 Tax=Clostridium lacusfryxellense TaxID=205328 RepID=UPI001C0B1A49|nr:hypothetical protein [Clostridium lacusfryxellense]MBU3112297.1 hypothetical protein [Clostridium lacusfryxellense]